MISPKKKNWVIFMLVAFSCYLWLDHARMKSTLRKALSSKNEISSVSDGLSTSLKNSYVLQEANWLHGMYGFREKSLALDYLDNSVLIEELINGENVYIFHFDANMCGPCLDKELDNLQRLSSIVGRENITLLATGFSRQYLFNDNKFSFWKDRLLASSDQVLNLGNLTETPVILKASKGSIELVYHAAKNNNLNFESLVKVLSFN